MEFFEIEDSLESFLTIKDNLDFNSYDDFSIRFFEYVEYVEHNFNLEINKMLYVKHNNKFLQIANKSQNKWVSFEKKDGRYLKIYIRKEKLNELCQI
jgi:hypothetical protein